VANQVLGVATDITQRRELEDQLRQAQKMDALGRLAGGIAHDFNNLLAVILGNAERMLRNAKTEKAATESEKKGLELIVSAGERAAMLVRQLLAFSRKQPLSPIVVDLNPVVAEMKDLLERLIGEHIRLEVNIEQAPCCVRADPGQIEQIIVNLAVNGRDAMPEGGALVIETAGVRLNADHAAKYPDAHEGPHVMLSIADTGVGIARETLDRIFEPFFTTKALGEGTGLGLATVYGIVKQAGGHIVAESEVDRGSVFKVYLPAVESPASHIEVVDAEAVVSGDETILVCEDEEDVLQLACGILEEHGYQTIATLRGDQALKQAAEHEGPIDLLLTDVVMPRMNGRQLAESLVTQRPGIKVLYMTGYSADVLGPMHARNDWGDWLTKPFTSAGLLKRVRAALDT
jgi:nitrogen-specific signal transduction histidine kinase